MTSKTHSSDSRWLLHLNLIIHNNGYIPVNFTDTEVKFGTFAGDCHSQHILNVMTDHQRKRDKNDVYVTWCIKNT